MSRTIYPLRALRTLALAAQCLHTPLTDDSTPDIHAVRRLVNHIGLVQIDTLQVVRRAQYLTLWSRLGNFDPLDLDRLAYDPTQRCLFEYWGHAATYIPLENYRYYLPAMQAHAENGWGRRWSERDGNAAVVGTVLERLEKGGAVRASQFENPGRPGGAWWDWKPAKVALEHLYNSGILMIADRINFQRVYDLSHRVLPGWVDTRPPAPEESIRHFVRLGTQGLGVFRAEQSADYTYSKRTLARPIIRELIQQGELVEIQGETAPGGTATWVVRSRDLPILEQAADGELQARRTTFLNPFDNLFWARKRDEQLWGFTQALEAYTPAPKRRWGYFSLPILHRDKLIGRFDPRLDRKNARLHILSIHLETGIQPTEELVLDTATAMHHFLRFHHAKDVAFEGCKTSEFAQKLASAL